MRSQSLSLAALTLFSGNALAAPAPAPAVVGSLYADGVQGLGKRAALSAYQPESAKCPNTPLVRDATELGSEESRYIASRKQKADAALSAWLQKQGSFSNGSQPIVALASSGGGYRALLAGAGVIKALDGRDSNTSVSGLYQALTYQSGLSGKFYLKRIYSCFLYRTLTTYRRRVAPLLHLRQQLAYDQLLAGEPLGGRLRRITFASCQLAILRRPHSIRCHHHRDCAQGRRRFPDHDHRPLGPSPVLSAPGRPLRRRLEVHVQSSHLQELHRLQCPFPHHYGDWCCR